MWIRYGMNSAEKQKSSYPIDNFGYGMREFAITDNNGYILQSGKEINS